MEKPLDEAMKNALVVFRKFPNEQLAKELADLLKTHQIHCEVVNDSPPVDITFSLNNMQDEYQLKIMQLDFPRATKLMEEQAKELVNQVERDHYLFSFSNEELWEVLVKPDEWSVFDQQLVKSILVERGKPVSEERIAELREQRIDELARPDAAPGVWIVIGYLLALAGGILALIIGWYFWKGAKTLPNGRRVFVYDATTRWHGRNMTFVGTAFFIIGAVLMLRNGLPS